MIEVYIDSQEKDNLEHEYNIEVEENISAIDVYTLKYSSSRFWTNPNKKVATLEEDGNGYKIKLDSKTIKLDYAEAEQVLVLLGYTNEEKIEFRKSEIIKKI